MKKKQRLWLGIGLAVIVLIFIGLNAESIWVRLGGQKPGQIWLIAENSGSSVYLDGKLFQTTNSADKTVKVAAAAAKKPHAIIVTKAGFWPWTKTVTLRVGQTLNLTSFNVPAKGTTTVITSSLPEYSAAALALKNSAAPAQANMIVSKSGNVGIWSDGKSVFAKWLPAESPGDMFCTEDSCDRQIAVVTPTTAVRSIAFYENRDGVILFASGNAIYAIEIDKKGTQNFQPVYTGTVPSFAVGGENFIYVSDDGITKKVEY